MTGLQPATPPPLSPSLSPQLSPGWGSAIYEGVVRHRRVRPRTHELAVRMFMMYLDLDEVAEVFKGRWLWSVERANVASFRRGDYLGGDQVGGPVPLKEAVLREVEGRLGFRPAGPVRMLTHLRYFGHCFNPVTFYYCFGLDSDRPEAIVAEITNTPWKERHRYVIDGRAATGEAGSRVISGEFEKAFHVSPFMPMEQHYRWHFRQPGERLLVHMENLDASGRIFDATLHLERREIRGVSLARVLWRYPFMSARVVAGIHWHALRLWAKGVPFVSHPKWRHPEPGGRRRNPDT